MGPAVLIPVAIFLALYFAKVASHAVFVFLMSTIVALLLNAVVLGMGRIKVPALGGRAHRLPGVRRP